MLFRSNNPLAQLHVLGGGIVSQNLLIGTATSTGTASQPLQVTGSAYVSGTVGVGVTIPSVALHLGTNSPEIRINNSSGNNFARIRVVTESVANAADLAFSVGAGEALRIINSGSVGIATTNPSYTLHVNGSFAATTKSFVIPHPTKENYKLRYASLEGEENGVYLRGRTTQGIIELPEYWTNLVDENSITVHLTPIGNKTVWVEEINNNKVYINSDDTIDCFYTVFAERKDVEKLVVEVEGN